MSSIDLLLDEENELTFQLNIEGSRPADSNCRLAIQNNEMTLMFEAKNSNPGEVEITIPSLKHVLKEGEYDMTLEVIVDDKYFTPLTITGNFENSVKVTAEAVVRTKKPKIKASAALIESPKVKNSKKSNVNETAPIKPSVSVRNKATSEKVEITDDHIMKILNALTK
jgi:hypothetical protein